VVLVDSEAKAMSKALIVIMTSLGGQARTDCGMGNTSARYCALSWNIRDAEVIENKRKGL
jgi:hypothetical protein